jgi:hypothetical protein
MPSYAASDADAVEIVRFAGAEGLPLGNLPWGRQRPQTGLPKKAGARTGSWVVVANEAFFEREQAAAVLKHGILSRYPRMFATMAGKRTGRVVYFDRYAGPGRYEDGAPGSPLPAIEAARETAKWAREVECLFTLDVCGHMFPDSDDRTRTAVDAYLTNPADSVRTVGASAQVRAAGSDYLEKA